MPDSGTIRRWHVPSTATGFSFSDDGMRVDSGVQQGDEVTCSACNHAILPDCCLCAPSPLLTPHLTRNNMPLFEIP